MSDEVSAADPRPPAPSGTRFNFGQLKANPVGARGSVKRRYDTCGYIYIIYIFSILREA